MIERKKCSNWLSIIDTLDRRHYYPFYCGQSYVHNAGLHDNATGHGRYEQKKYWLLYCIVRSGFKKNASLT